MHPLARAAADRLLFETANLRYVVTTLPKGGLDEPIAGGDWNPRQLLAHVSAYLDLQGSIIERVLKGEAPLPEGFRMEEFHDRTPENDGAPLPDLLDRLSAARDRLATSLADVTDEHLATQFRTATIAAAIERWPRHVAAHGLEIVSTHEEFHVDPFVLNWLLPIDFNDESAAARQRAIRASGKKLLDEIEAAEES